MAEGPDLPSDLQRRWIIANAVAMLAIAACGFAGYLLRAALEIDSAETGNGVRAIYIAAETVLTVVWCVVYARLTADVLRTILPALPWRSWIGVHAVIGLVWGSFTGLVNAMPIDGAGPMDWSDLPLTTFIFVAYAVAGAAVGAAVGGIEALILCKVAAGMGIWIKISALSTSVDFALQLGALVIAPQDRTLIAEAISEAAVVFAGIVAAVIMLHALAKLRPKID